MFQEITNGTHFSSVGAAEVGASLIWYSHFPSDSILSGWDTLTGNGINFSNMDWACALQKFLQKSWPVLLFLPFSFSVVGFFCRCRFSRFLFQPLSFTTVVFFVFVSYFLLANPHRLARDNSKSEQWSECGICSTVLLAFLYFISIVFFFSKTLAFSSFCQW